MRFTRFAAARFGGQIVLYRRGFAGAGVKEHVINALLDRITDRAHVL